MQQQRVNRWLGLVSKTQPDILLGAKDRTAKFLLLERLVQCCICQASTTDHMDRFVEGLLRLCGTGRTSSVSIG